MVNFKHILYYVLVIFDCDEENITVGVLFNTYNKCNFFLCFLSAIFLSDFFC